MEKEKSRLISLSPTCVVDTSTPVLDWLSLLTQRPIQPAQPPPTSLFSSFFPLLPSLRFSFYLTPSFFPPLHRQSLFTFIRSSSTPPLYSNSSQPSLLSSLIQRDVTVRKTDCCQIIENCGASGYSGCSVDSPVNGGIKTLVMWVRSDEAFHETTSTSRPIARPGDARGDDDRVI